MAQAKITPKEIVIFHNEILASRTKTVTEKLEILPNLAKALLRVETSRHKFFKQTFPLVINLLKTKHNDSESIETTLTKVVSFGSDLVNDNIPPPSSLTKSDELIHERDMLGSLLFQVVGYCLTKLQNQAGQQAIDKLLENLGCLRLQLIPLTKALANSKFPSEPQPHWLRHGVAWFCFNVLLHDKPIPLSIVFSPLHLYVHFRRLLAASLTSNVPQLGNEAVEVLDLLLPRIAKRLEGEDMKLLKAIPQHLMTSFDDADRKKIFSHIEGLIQCFDADTDRLDCYCSLLVDTSIHPAIRSLLITCCRDRIIRAINAHRDKLAAIQQQQQQLQQQQQQQPVAVVNVSCFLSVRVRDVMVKMVRHVEGDDSDQQYWYGRVGAEVEVMIAALNVLRFMVLSKHVEQDMWGVRDVAWRAAFKERMLLPMQKFLVDTAAKAKVEQTHDHGHGHGHGHGHEEDPSNAHKLMLLTVVDRVIEIIDEQAQAQPQQPQTQQPQPQQQQQQQQEPEQPNQTQEHPQ